MSSTHPLSRAWWKSAVIYQIYPISFFDSNGDGFGDLNGIHSKLDYLKDLGVDVIWLSPIYKSPLADMGYDIADYRAIDPRYGTLDDWDNLIKGVHDRGMKLVMDLVVNHTSDEHDWFVQSRSGKDNPKRDWYIWRPPKYDSDGNRIPPNNWRSVFQGPAWDYDEVSGEYYLHLYVAKQPDLNWDNPDVREAVFDLMKFWLDRGCDGFRMDVINLISKVDGLPDAPVVDLGDPTQHASIYYANGPRVHQYVKEMNEKVLSRYDVMTVGEAPFSHSASDLAEYVLPANKELNMVFQFEMMDIDSVTVLEPLMPKKWVLPDLKHVVEKWQTFERDQGFWNSVFIENHDQSRAVSRFGNDSPKWRTLSAKLISLLHITQGGTLYVYQGQEIAMSNFPKTWSIDEYKDVATINYWNRILESRKKQNPGKEIDMSDILAGCQHKARDHSRTPMQWDSTPHAGFTNGTPWMRVNDDYASSWNVSHQLEDPTSVQRFYKQAIELRKRHDVLIYGDFHIIRRDHPQVFSFARTSEDTSMAVVMLNFSEDEVKFEFDPTELPGITVGSYGVILSNYDNPPLDGGLIPTSTTLKAYEGRLYLTEGLRN